MLELKITSNDTQDAILRVINGYNKEVRIQSRYGGIREPDQVLSNKVRHECTNYDQVMDSINQDRTISDDEANKLRRQVINKVHILVAELLEEFPNLVITHERRKITVVVKDLKRSNDRYRERELRKL